MTTRAPAWSRHPAFLTFNCHAGAAAPAQEALSRADRRIVLWSQDGDIRRPVTTERADPGAQRWSM